MHSALSLLLMSLVAAVVFWWWTIAHVLTVFRSLSAALLVCSFLVVWGTSALAAARGIPFRQLAAIVTGLAWGTVVFWGVGTVRWTLECLLFAPMALLGSVIPVWALGLWWRRRRAANQALQAAAAPQCS